jgi:predicted ATP-binding protein involved in virulence
VKLTRIKIEKLFGQFDYDIELNQEEGITILTGPNGYGKTTVLNIVYNLYPWNLKYFENLIFNNISLTFDNNESISLLKEENSNIAINYSSVNSYSNFWKEKGGFISQIAYIKDQRVFSSVKSKLLKTIEHYAELMASQLRVIKDQEVKLSENLTATQFNRIKDCTPFPEKEYKTRFDAFLGEYQKLVKIGIYSENIQYADYHENQQYLSVFLADYEKKVKLYEDIIPNAYLFVCLINDKALTNKIITLDVNHGFSAKLNNGNIIPLTKLSSGEQEEIILLYELLFRAEKGALVLIDEPETSMHVAWQQLFLKDLEAIGKLNSLSFLVATHSPDIIGDKLKWVVDLYELSQRGAE